MLNLTPDLSDNLISLTKLCDSDFDALYAIAGDELLWQQHPAKERYKRENFERWFESALDTETVLKIIDLAYGRVIGSSRFYDYKPKQEIAVGHTFLGRDYWGGEYNCHLKKLMFDYAFTDVEHIWLHIGANNLRSQKASEKIGAVHVSTEMLGFSGNELSEYFCYKITREQWQQRT